MNIRTVCLGVLAATVIGGSALAGILDEPKMMAPFFTDKTMKTMKADADMKKVWAKMSKKHQAAMMKECQDAAMSKPHAEFCAKLNALAGKA
ncbi:hypothetical protein EB233_13995 [Mesorhizobium erdmanii]|uniref:Uncharacterized protein n=2 Tax=Mesorhizobium erdmanii TaxID=1777866 RepID=A0A6M7UEZ8_9HYPH|nr:MULTISPECIES: hypothetical protein [Mesorhizobium]OBQ73308.1 hypothetical protein A8146_24590 [Mesorhizobium loti]QKC76499.1 hypothetical protein EB233_13995 [Mesorhizobium erdmanii]